MGLSRLSKKCRVCPYVGTCENKQMEALAYLDEPSMIAEAGQSTLTSAAAPLLRETTTINIGDGKMVEVYKDEVEKELTKHLYSHLGLQYGG